jgi:hypothetical protein
LGVRLELADQSRKLACRGGNANFALLGHLADRSEQSFAPLGNFDGERPGTPLCLAANFHSTLGPSGANRGLTRGRTLTAAGGESFPRQLLSRLGQVALGTSDLAPPISGAFLREVSLDSPHRRPQFVHDLLTLRGELDQTAAERDK